MPLISLVSLKGSPGVTTTALALAAAWPAPRRLLAELDPAGGDLEIRLGLPAGSGGLAGLAAAARRPQSRHSLWAFACELAGGLHVLPAPPGAGQAGACLQTLADAGVLPRLAAEAAAGEAVVIADCGRLDPAAVTGQAGALAGVVLVVARPRLSDLAHLAGRLDAIRQHATAAGLVLVTGGGLPHSDPAYPAAEISQALAAPVLGSLPADPRGVAALLAGHPPGRARRRLWPLAAAARDLAAAVAATLPAGPDPVPGTAAAGGQDTLPAGQASAPAEVISR
jgi:MinD-like ATPase involved in chromosome partitioning or flagellar assembly